MKKLFLTIMTVFFLGFMMNAQGNGTFNPVYKANWGNGIEGRISKFVHKNVHESGTYEIEKLGDGIKHIVTVLLVGNQPIQMRFYDYSGNRSSHNVNWGDLKPADKIWWEGTTDWIEGARGFDIHEGVFLAYCGNSGVIRRPHDNTEPVITPVGNGGNDNTTTVDDDTHQDNNDNSNIIIEDEGGDDSYVDDNGSKPNCNNNGGIQLQNGGGDPSTSPEFGSGGGGIVHTSPFTDDYYNHHQNSTVDVSDHKNLGWKIAGGIVGGTLVATGAILIIKALINKTTNPLPPDETKVDVPGPTNPEGPGNGHFTGGSIMISVGG